MIEQPMIGWKETKKRAKMRYKEVKKHIVKNEDGVELASFLEERHARDYMELRSRLDRQKFTISVELKQVRSGKV